MGHVDSPKTSTGSTVNSFSSNAIQANTVNDFIKKGNYAERTISLPEGGSYKMTISFNGITNEIDKDKFLNNIDKVTIDAIINISVSMGLGQERKASNEKRAKVQAVNFSLDENKKFSANKIFENNFPNTKTVNCEYYTLKSTTPSNGDPTIVNKNEKRLKKATMFNDLDDLFSRSDVKKSSEKLPDTASRKEQIKDASNEEPSDELQKNSSADRLNAGKGKSVKNKIKSVATKYKKSKANSEDRTPIVARRFWEEYPIENSKIDSKNFNNEINSILDENGSIAQKNTEEKLRNLIKIDSNSSKTVDNTNVQELKGNVDIAKHIENEINLRVIVENNPSTAPKFIQTPTETTYVPIPKIEDNGAFLFKGRFKSRNKNVLKDTKPKNTPQKIENTPTKSITPKTGQTESEAWNNFGNTSW